MSAPSRIWTACRIDRCESRSGSRGRLLIGQSRVASTAAGRGPRSLALSRRANERPARPDGGEVPRAAKRSRSTNKTDVDPDRGAVLIRHGKGDKRREVGMDRWAWAQLEPWLDVRASLPAGALFCILRGSTRGSTRGRPCAPAGVRGDPQPRRHGHGQPDQAVGDRRREPKAHRDRRTGTDRGSGEAPAEVCLPGRSRADDHVRPGQHPQAPSSGGWLGCTARNPDALPACVQLARHRERQQLGGTVSSDDRDPNAIVKPARAGAIAYMGSARPLAAPGATAPRGSEAALSGPAARAWLCSWRGVRTCWSGPRLVTSFGLLC